MAPSNFQRTWLSSDPAKHTGKPVTMSSLIACGINYKTAPLAVRERLAFDSTQAQASLQQLLQQGMAQEAVILSTCNRTEIYCHAPTEQPVLTWLSTASNIPYAEIQPHLYCHQEQAAVQHILRVASGLDSMVLGESQILGQMKQAFSLAKTVGALGTQLHKLAQHIFAVSKQVRTDTAIGTNSLSIAYIAVKLAQKIFADLHHNTALLIGAGDTTERVAQHLASQQIKQLIFANRTLEHAQRLAQKHPHSIAVELHDMPRYLAQADIVIAATNSHLPLLGKGSIESALKIRKRKPILMLDLAVPRNIETEVSELADVYLYTIDDLKQVISYNLRDRHAAAEQAEHIILAQSHAFMDWRARLANVTIARAYRESALALRDKELRQHLAALRRGEPAEDVITQLALRLTNKLVHQPTVDIKQYTADDTSEILAQARQLFSIE